MSAVARGDSLAYFLSMPAEHQDALGWRTARGDLLPAPFWPGGRLARKPLDDDPGGVVFFKVGDDRTAPADADEAVREVTTTSPLVQRAERHLRETCAIYRIDPPSVADVHEYASVAYDVLEDGIAPMTWLDDFIDARETIAGNRCQSIFRRLDLYARLDDPTAQTVADTSEDARFASPCDPRVLVLVTTSGGAIVADLSAGAVHEYTPTLPRRARRAARRAARRTMRRDRRLHHT